MLIQTLTSKNLSKNPLRISAKENMKRLKDNWQCNSNLVQLRALLKALWSGMMILSRDDQAWTTDVAIQGYMNLIDLIGLMLLTLSWNSNMLLAISLISVLMLGGQELTENRLLFSPLVELW